MQNTSVRNQTTTTSQESYTTHFITSKDGTNIGYRRYGHGPGIVLVQGTMGTAHNFAQLAGILSKDFTVYVPDRRGRGLSGPGNSKYNIQKEVEDLEAILTTIGTHSVFGLSSGAIISLQAALTRSAIQKLAIFEPPLYAHGTVPTALITRYENEMSQGRVAAALITGMKAGQFGPPIFSALPRWLLELFTEMMMRGEEKKGFGGYVPMRQLASTLHYDFELVNAMSDKLNNFRAVRNEVLLLGGSDSPDYLRYALDELEKILPYNKRIEFSGLGHAAAWNTDRGGQPEIVALELQRFFA